MSTNPMKKPKVIRRFNPKLGKHTEHTLKQVKSKGRNSARPMSRGSKTRTAARGVRRGTGNLGRYSRPTNPKMSGKKRSKRIAFVFTCNESGYAHQSNAGKRAKKVELV